MNSFKENLIFLLESESFREKSSREAANSVITRNFPDISCLLQSILLMIGVTETIQ